MTYAHIYAAACYK